MSSPLAVAAVSAVLRNLLDNGLVDVSGTLGPVTVSAVAPDRIDLDAAEPAPRLNVFLHHAGENAAWRNRELPSRNALGDRTANPPLALDLDYLITAYGFADLEAEILLGYAMQILHERPMLDRVAIRRALDPSPLDVSMLPPPYQALVASDLADQFEAIRITPVPMGSDEMSKLWSAVQSHYRPSAAYRISVVLIESTRAARSGLPVLTRGGIDADTGRDRGVFVQPDLLPPGPTLLKVLPPQHQSAARLGDTVTVEGVRLVGSGMQARLRHHLLGDEALLLPVTAAPTGRSATFTLPLNVATNTAMPAGLWQLSFVLTPPGETVARETNSLPLLLAPDPVIAADATLNLAALSIQRTAQAVTVRLFSRPRVRLEQPAVLALNTHTAVAAVRAGIDDALVFTFPPELPAAAAWLRLRVDGVDSLLVDKNAVPPRFRPDQQITVPA